MCLLGFHRQGENYRCTRCGKGLLETRFEDLLGKGVSHTYSGLARSSYAGKSTGDTLTVSNLRKAVERIKVDDTVWAKTFKKYYEDTDASEEAQRKEES